MISYGFDKKTNTITVAIDMYDCYVPGYKGEEVKKAANVVINDVDVLDDIFQFDGGEIKYDGVFIYSVVHVFHDENDSTTIISRTPFNGVRSIENVCGLNRKEIMDVYRRIINF